MKSASRVAVGLVAALSFTVAIADEGVQSNADVRYVIARADGPGVSAPITDFALDAYAGRYDAAEGTAFVYREGDSLTIEVPEQFGETPMRLHAAETRDTFATEESVRVVFESDASGQVLGLVLHGPNGRAIAASKAPARRGVVTVHDLADLRRGVVTVHDIADLRRGIVTVYDLAEDDISSSAQLASLVSSF